MHVPSPAELVEQKQAELVACIRSKADTFDNRVLEEKIAAALANTNLAQRNVMLGDGHGGGSFLCQRVQFADALESQGRIMERAAGRRKRAQPPCRRRKRRVEPREDPYDQMMAELRKLWTRTESDTNPWA